MDEASFGIFTFRDITRFIAWSIEQPYNLILALISKGFLSGQGHRCYTNTVTSKLDFSNCYNCFYGNLHQR